MTIVGNGTHRYEMNADWAKLPDHVRFGYAHGIVTDDENNVYVFHTNEQSVVKFDPSGRYIESWGDEYAGGAHGFYLHKEGNEQFLYVTDTARGLMVKTTLRGEKVLELGAPDLPDVYDADRKYIPTDVAVAPNGDIYVTDGYGQNWIHRYRANGEYIDSFGGKGSGVGQLNCPHGISVDVRSGEPELYVADRGNHRIQVFTLTGEPKRVIDQNMDMPCSFYFHGSEMVFPDLHSRITIFDGDDRLITHLGEDQQAYKQKGWPNVPDTYFRDNRFSSPHGVCVDSGGNIYVAEWTQYGRVTKLSRL
jgi:sugar lactone lactonase YvrE